MKRNWIVPAGISVAALIAAGLHLAWPEIKIDSITIGLVVIAVLPWLAPLFKSVKIPGGWEFVFKEAMEAKQAANEAKGAAESTAKRVELASAGNVPGVATYTADPMKSPEDELRLLAQKYNEIRETQRSGSARTAAMTDVFRQMIALAPELKQFDVKQYLKATDRGMRLAAYAYLYALPNFALLDDLVTSVTEVEDKSFGQYWGLEAIAKVIDGRKLSDLSPLTAEKLQQALLTRFHSGTDRHFVLSRILRDLKGTDRS
jgi:hypothetical protein